MNGVKGGFLTVSNKKYDLSKYGELMYTHPEGGRLVVQLRTVNGPAGLDEDGQPLPNPVVLPIVDQGEASRLQDECNAFWRVHGRA